MAIIQPARSFEGSDLSSSAFGKIIKDGVRTVSFREDKNKEGNFFFILPPYKADRFGKGVSWRTVEVRDNFGAGNTKEKFAIRDSCPISYFANQVKLLFPGYAKVEEEADQTSGQKRKRYPTFGRITKKVLFNVAYFKDLSLGAHVMELPQYGAAEKIEQYGRQKNPDGTDKALLNDWKGAIPVWVHLNMSKGKGGNPWEVTIEASQKYPLPEGLADSDNLYNLDDVIEYPEADTLVEKLRQVTPTDIFDTCMEGYFKMKGKQTLPRITDTGTATLVTAPAPAAFSLPKAVIPGKPIETAIPQTHVETTSNPTARFATKEQAQAWLAQKVG